MKTTKKLIFTLLAGATLGLASPVFADSYRHDRGYDQAAISTGTRIAAITHIAATRPALSSSSVRITCNAR